MGEVRELTLDEIHGVLLDIVDDISCLFQKYGIPWFLEGGSLLGAVRHHGFIPWDDDVDIHVPIAYFKKACKVLCKESRFKLYSLWTQENYCFVQAKLCDMETKMVDTTKVGKIYNYERGVAVDIFPLFGADDYGGIRKKRIDFAAKMMGGYYVCFYQHTAFRGRWITRLAAHTDRILPRHNIGYWKEKTFKLLQECRGGHYVTEYWEIPVKWNAEDFADSLLMDFEGRKYPAPIGYDRVLRDYFGDYMQLPPAEERKGHSGKKYIIEV